MDTSTIFIIGWVFITMLHVMLYAEVLDTIVTLLGRLHTSLEETKSLLKEKPIDE